MINKLKEDAPDHTYFISLNVDWKSYPFQNQIHNTLKCATSKQELNPQ